MKRIFAGVALVAGLAGCATQSAPTWVTTESKDQFTDAVTRMVTYGDVHTSHYIVTRSLHYYPFIGTQNGELFVGIRSGGPHRIPTGTVQIRIDNNAAWTITPDETPLSLVPAVTAAPAVAGVDAKTAELIAQTQKTAMEGVSKAMSPYTAATGDKARQILRQMLSGQTIIYRTVGLNQAASTTGEAKIDASFREALRKIGIDPENAALE